MRCVFGTYEITNYTRTNQSFHQGFVRSTHSKNNLGHGPPLF